MIPTLRHSAPATIARRVFTVALAAGFVAGLATACGGGGGRAEIEPGQTLPDLALPDLAGETVRTSELTGRPLVLSFWATWCQPCVREIPLLEELHADPRFRLVTIALDEEGREAVEPFVADRGLGYPVLLGDQRTFERLGGLAIPYTLLVASDGRIADVVRGSLERDRTEALLLSSSADGPARPGTGVGG